MARYTGAVCRLCRREGKKLFLKGERCYTEKCSFTKRPRVPGQHGQGRKKVSEYGIQLRAKQQAKRFYGVNEVQFYKYFEMATKRKGISGENLLSILETRLDNVIYRLGFAMSRAQARQMVRHGFFDVNGKRVNIPSYLTVPGEIITIRDKFKTNGNMKKIVEAKSSHLVPEWIEYDKTQLSGKIKDFPTREQIDLDVEEHLIVELYSK